MVAKPEDFPKEWKHVIVYTQNGMIYMGKVTKRSRDYLHMEVTEATNDPEKLLDAKEKYQEHIDKKDVLPQHIVKKSTITAMTSIDSFF